MGRRIPGYVQGELFGIVYDLMIEILNLETCLRSVPSEVTISYRTGENWNFHFRGPSEDDFPPTRS